MKHTKAQYSLGILRIALGLMFLWAFFDKLFGLGFATTPEKSWLMGNSPTAGFLQFGTHGPFASWFQALAGSPIVDFLFMMGLFCIGLALVLGIGMKIASSTGATLLFLMWLSSLPPENHPFLDEHIIYILALCVLHCFSAGQFLGFGKQWSKTKMVKRFGFLE